jgi:hypothetical protein
MSKTAPLRATLRHFFAWVATTAAWLILWTVGYLVLLLWAILADEPIGSPVVWPLGLLGILLLHTAAVLVIFLPSTLAAELLCTRNQLPKVRAGLAFAFSLFLIILAIISGFVLLWGGTEAPTFLEAFFGLLLIFAIPMGAYWWASQFPSLLRIGAQKLFPKPSAQPKQNLPS